MAEKIVNGIGREIRYVEYKLRKKNGKSKKKTKNGPNTFGGDIQPRHQASDYTEGSGSGSVSADMLEALPKDRTEESIQMQVALAMSKEENQEEQKQLDSDKIRLELAIKESLEKSKHTQQQPQETKQQSSDLLGFSQQSKPTPAANNDPWGNTVSQQSLFQPNSAPVTNDPWGTTATVTSATAPQTQAQDAWGMPALSTPQTAALSQDPWGAASSQNAPLPVTQTAPQANDPWGAPPRQSQPAFPVSNQVDAWGAAAPQAYPQTNDFANKNNFATSSPSTDLFGAPATTMSPPESFDPLHDFDNLRVSDNNKIAPSADAMSPIVLSSDTTSNIAFDILPLTDAPNTNTADNNEITVETTKGSSLIDGTQGLVNLDNLLSGPGSTNPYYNNNMKSLSGNTNAFTPRTTQPSMNQMRGGNTTQAPFPVGNTQTPSFSTGTAQTAFALGNTAPVPTMQPNALYPSLQMQSPMVGMYGQPTNPMFGQQTTAMAPTNVNQTNLFLQ